MDIPRIMVFRPSYAEFKNFPEYISYMEKCGAHKAGLAKVNIFINYVYFEMLVYNLNCAGTDNTPTGMGSAKKWL